jgi:hypothetical protein
MKTKPTTLGTLASVVGVALGILYLVGCGGKKEVTPVPVGDLSEYVDPVHRYHVSHPQGWVSDIEAGRRARFFSAEGVKERFLDPTGAYPDGASINVEVRRTAAADSVMKSILDGKAEMGFVLKDQDTVTVDGLRCPRVPYLGNFGGGIMLYGEHIYAKSDTMIYQITFEGFGDQYEAHRAVFDASLSAFKIPVPIEPGRDVTLPSGTMARYEGKVISFMYPDNFNFESTSDTVIALRGVRQDCFIGVNIFAAQGNDAGKVLEQNISNFRNASKGTTTVNGLPAPYFTYAPARQVERRFYFIVKDDKVHRITLDWYRPQRSEYLEAYNTVLQSIQLK